MVNYEFGFNQSETSAKPKAEADNTYRDLDYLGYHKNRIYYNCFIIHCFEENSDKHTVAGNWFNIVIQNHALRAQPTD